MKRVQIRLTEWTLALFVASVATPHAGGYFHHHIGGDHAHVHPDDDDHDHDADHDDDLDQPHHHHDQLAGVVEEPAFELPDHDETGHWHSQNRFHRAVAPALITVDSGRLIESLCVPPDLAAVDLPCGIAHARGPPRTV